MIFGNYETALLVPIFACACSLISYLAFRNTYEHSSTYYDVDTDMSPCIEDSNNNNGHSVRTGRAGSDIERVMKSFTSSEVSTRKSTQKAEIEMPGQCCCISCQAPISSQYHQLNHSTDPEQGSNSHDASGSSMNHDSDNINRNGYQSIGTAENGRAHHHRNGENFVGPTCNKRGCNVWWR